MHAHITGVGLRSRVPASLKIMKKVSAKRRLEREIKLASVVFAVVWQYMKRGTLLERRADPPPA